MGRYFFHTQNGECVADHEGAELADVEQAKREAVQLLSELTHNHSEILLETGQLSIRVTDATGLTLFTVESMINAAPATQGQGRKGRRQAGASAPAKAG